MDAVLLTTLTGIWSPAFMCSIFQTSSPEHNVVCGALNIFLKFITTIGKYTQTELTSETKTQDLMRHA